MLGRRWTDGLDRLPDQDIPTHWLTRIITVVPLAWIALQCLLDALAEQPRPAPVIALLTLVVAAQMAVVTVGTRCRTNGQLLAILCAQAALTYLPILWYGAPWARMTGPLAASVLLVNMRGVWLVWSLVVASSLGIAWAEVPFLTAVSYAMYTVLAGWMIWGFSRLSSLVAEVHAERSELARAAVTRERLRFSRDLHDLLGGSISAVILKGELAHRLVPAEERRARQEIAAVLDISRQALAELRVVAKGYRYPMSFAAEQESVRSVLTTAGVDVTMMTEPDRLDPALDAVLAIVLREGSTNILKHSNAGNCHVTLTVSHGTARLVMVNDGVVPSATGQHGGQGLANIGARLAEFGGRTEAGVHKDGLFHLVAEAPLWLAEPPLRLTEVPLRLAEAPLPLPNCRAAAVEATGGRESAPAWGRSARNESKRPCTPESCSPRMSLWSAEHWPPSWSWRRI
ncbi:sensor histidine kinase [Streptomyces sp. DSM 40750]|uniref:sensor histidine kinase n=1 Tax=Streptomyces sp. DSM 40750 TaxID=2801030 RepID=UPI00214ACC17|nr:histidine kinase [Streptomyces sp. DSM 40750]UUU26911.1 histidine kinase [Streptomyces sp. DSM 40750]